MSDDLKDHLVAMNLDAYFHGQIFILESIIRTLESQLKVIKELKAAQTNE